MYSLVNNEMNGSKKNEIIELMDTSIIINSVMTKKNESKQNNDDDDKGKKLNEIKT